MDPLSYLKYVILSVLVIAWCVLHSAMISITVTEYLHKRLGQSFRFYRLFFNVVSVLTLVPVILYASSVRTEPIFHWNGYWRIIQALLLGTGVLLFFLGAARYDGAQFLGPKQLRAGTSNKGITDSGTLDTSGILRLMRHPWYLASLLLIWVREPDLSTILVNVIFTLYLMAGTYLEEKKLIRAFGDKDLAYQKRVPRLIPYKWLKSKTTQ